MDRTRKACRRHAQGARLRSHGRGREVHAAHHVDGDKADAIKVKGQLPKGTVYQSAELPCGKRVVSHARFIVMDHELLLLTSANFSFSAENRNVEFSLLVRDSSLAESVESTMTSKHSTLYEMV